MSEQKGQQPATPQPSHQPRPGFRPVRRTSGGTQPTGAPPSKRGNGRWKVIVGMTAGLVGLMVVAGLMGNGGKGVSISQVQVSQPAVTTTQPAEATPGAGYSPATSDWVVGITVLGTQCSGSSDCRTTFRLDPRYVGAVALPSVGTTVVTYAVDGGVDPYSRTFTVDATGKVSTPAQEEVRTSSSSPKLAAVVTGVTYDRNR